MEPNEQIPEETAKAAAGTGKAKPTELLQSVLEWLEIIVISFLIVMTLITFFIRHSPVSGSSMVPTLHNSDILLISNLGYTPARGDIIVVQDTGEPPFADAYGNMIESPIGLDEPLVKRVIAIGGDTVDIDFDNWIITVTTAEGETIVYEDEPYVNRVTGAMKRSPFPLNYPLKVEEGSLFVMGDNRNGSTDSRDRRVGLVDERYIVGHVIFRLFPLNRIGSLIGA